MIDGRRGVLWCAIPALGLLFACGIGGGEQQADPAAGVIATVGDRSLTRGEFDNWLAATLGGAEESAAAGPEVKSRLLDQYLDEELILAAAVAQGLAVTEEEVAKLSPTDGIETETSKRLLLQKKYKEQVIFKGVTVSEDEVRAWFQEHLDEYHRPARVVIRQILVDTEKEARRIRAELGADPEKFEEIAETLSLAPDGGVPTALEETILPDTIRAAIAVLKKGELSQVVKDSQGFMIFKLEERQAEQAPSLDEARQEIELELLRERSQQRYREFIARLRESIKVAIIEGALGFQYVRKSPA